MSVHSSSSFVPDGYCPECGYSTGIGTCPECGTAVQKDMLASSPRIARALAWERLPVVKKGVLLPWYAVTFVRLLFSRSRFPDQRILTRHPVLLLLGAMLIAAVSAMIWDLREVTSPERLLQHGLMDRRVTFSFSVMCLVLSLLTYIALRRRRTGRAFWRASLYGLMFFTLLQWLFVAVVTHPGWIDPELGYPVFYEFVGPVPGGPPATSSGPDYAADLRLHVLIGLSSLNAIFFVLALPMLAARSCRTSVTDRRCVLEKPPPTRTGPCP